MPLPTTRTREDRLKAQERAKKETPKEREARHARLAKKRKAARGK